MFTAKPRFSPGILVCLALLLPAIALAQSIPPGRELLNAGVREFKQGNYVQAAQYLRHAVAADPQSVLAHLYLAQSLYSQYIPGADGPDQLRAADEARAEWQTVLTLDPPNVTATASMASLYYNQKKYEEAEDWNKKVIALDPNNKEAFYTLGVLAWTRWYALDREARSTSNQRPEDPGPIGDAALRQQLKPTWLPVLDEGISNMQKALQLDPHYDDAMAYMNLLVRYRGDLLDTPDEWKAASDEADQWMQKSIDAKRAKAEQSTANASPPPSHRAPRVAPEVISANLITRVDPVYPPLARQARISGTVRFNITIGADGLVKNLQLVSGHPLLVSAAREAVAQYVYKPTLLNGEQIEVASSVSVLFENP